MCDPFFEYGPIIWKATNATAVYDNQVTVTRKGADGRVSQNIYMEAGRYYEITLSVVSTSSTAFVNWIDPDGTNTLPIDNADAGVHTLTIKPTVSGYHEIGVGANDPVDSTVVVDFLGVRINNCELTGGEYLHNSSFDCSLDGWTFDSNYPATLTDNKDGSIHIKSNSKYGSVVPVDALFDDGDYLLEINVANVSGNGKMSI
jgi:hypothetical protein